MNNFFGQLRQKLSKPVLFGLCGAVGCLGAATLLGEPLLQLTKISPKVDQSPLAIVLLIDTSGSMNDDGKLREVKTAAQAFVQRQDLSENRLAVFGFGSNIQAAARLTDNKPTLEQAIAQISDGGGTNMDQALLAATQELQSTSQRRNILLFTDGQPGYAGANLDREKAKTLEAMGIATSEGINLVAVATGDADTNFLAKLTGDPDRVFYVNSGDFDQAFRQAEKAIYSSQLVESGPTGNYGVVYSLLRIGGWTALLAIGTSLALIAGQNYYLRRRLLTPKQVGMGIVGGLMAGLVAGGVGQLLFIPFAGIPILAIGGRIIGWAILGSVVGGGMSFFVPNLQWGRAVQGGALGGNGRSPWISDCFGGIG
ncbi:MAG: VWA domain-containing protein [Planktothrix sp. GU0601_MAG3]|nr:MAG: VWA domain-containing protein [Planktothrix sp. GU0601_MAG3]